MPPLARIGFTAIAPPRWAGPLSPRCNAGEADRANELFQIQFQTKGKVMLVSFGGFAVDPAEVKAVTVFRDRETSSMAFSNNLSPSMIAMVLLKDGREFETDAKSAADFINLSKSFAAAG